MWVTREAVFAALLSASAHAASLPAFDVPLAAVTASLKNSTSCCAAIGFFLKDRVVYPSNSLYQASLDSYYADQESDIRPSCIVRPGSSKDIAISVAVLNIGDKLKVRGCDFGVRSGGHTPWGGAGNARDGVTIDLQTLNQLIVSPDRTTAALGSGNRWQDIYPKLDAMGLAMVGGRVSPVGSGGLITGGGISYFNARKGWASDNVLNFEVVLASGQIVNANASSNPDLFRALRGGSNNFGIVTRFDVAIFEQGDLWGGYLIQAGLSEQDAHFAFFEEFAKSETYDEYAHFILSYAVQAVTPGSPLQWSAAVNPIYTKPEPFPAVFKPLTDQPALLSTLRTAPLSNFTDEIAAGAALPPTRGRYYFWTLTALNNAAYMKAFFALAEAWLLSVGDVPGLSVAVSYQPLPRIMTGQTSRKGGNVLGLETAPDLQLINIGLSWSRAADDERLNASLQDLYARATARAREMGVWHPYIYLNYATQFQDTIASYGAASVEFMKRVSRKVDPSGLFQRRVGGHKLPK